MSGGDAHLSVIDSGPGIERARWTTLFTADRDLHHVHFADDRHGWLAGFGGALWRTEDGGAHWAPQDNPTDVTASCLAFAPHGGTFGLAPLWSGKVLRTTTGESWQAVDVPLDYALPSAVVVDPGCAYVLGSDGRLAHYVDPRVPEAK